MAVGDRGKAPNTTGTQPRRRTKSPATPGRKGVESGGGRGPKKTRARTTTRSADK
jgi:hypothetical protein